MTPAFRVASAIVALALALAAPLAQAKRVRVFAVGPKFSLDWVDTRAHYHDKLFALVDATKRTAEAPIVQEGAGDVASVLLHPADPGNPAQTARDLITFPEDLGLMAAFTGGRGAMARNAPSLDVAIAGLIGTYGPVATYYAAKFPDLTQRPFPPTRLLGIALTDTFARVAVETLAEIADHYDAYVVAGVSLAQDWHVVCDDKTSYQPPPGGTPCDEEDRAKVDALRSPDEPNRDYAYEATTSKLSNMALVFDPDGRLISKQVKAYLTPVELPGQLDLVPGEISSGLSALETPVGRLGFVISKDAWMPDVIDRLDEAHVELLIQPEFFLNDTVRSGVPWAPDNIQGAGPSALLRAPSFEAMALPSMTGNVFDFSADQQQVIAVKPRSVRRPPLGAFVGQPLAPGFTAVAPWVVKDPLQPGEPFPERRRRLALAGDALLPGGDGPDCADPRRPGPCKGGQVEGVLFADVQIAQPRGYRRQARRRRGKTVFTTNAAIAPSRAPQRNVALAARGQSVYAAFEEHRGIRDQVLLVRSRDNGAHWSRPLHVTRRAPRAADERWPAVAVGPTGTVWLTWQDDSSGTPRVYYSRSTDDGDTFGPPVAVDASPPGAVPQRRPAIAATGANTAVVAWVDERARSADDDLPQAGIRLVGLQGNKPGPSARLDATADAAALAAKLDHGWAPSVAARGRQVLVSWIDFHNYEWEVFARLSTDGGATFGAEQKVNDTPAENEAIANTPRAGIGDRGPLVAYTDWRLDASSATEPSPLYDVDVAVPGAKHRQVDGHGGHHVSAFAPALLMLGSGKALVAFEDHARGPGDIFIARIGAKTGTASKPQRVDDSGAAGWNQWRPALALTSRRVIAAWEDERDGPVQIYAGRVRASRIR